MNDKVVLIIQARMGSSRLPGKSMMDLAGAPLVGRILERVRRVNRIDQIVLATSDQKQDDVLEKLGIWLSLNGSHPNILYLSPSCITLKILL